MLSSVTLNCQVTIIVMSSGSQLSEMSTISHKLTRHVMYFCLSLVFCQVMFPHHSDQTSQKSLRWLSVCQMALTFNNIQDLVSNKTPSLLIFLSRPPPSSTLSYHLEALHGCIRSLLSGWPSPNLRCGAGIGSGMWLS